MMERIKKNAMFIFFTAVFLVILFAEVSCIISLNKINIEWQTRTKVTK